MLCDRCNELASELRSVRVGDLVVLEACPGCADQIAGELLSGLAPAGLARRWETIGQIGRATIDASRALSAFGVAGCPECGMRHPVDPDHAAGCSRPRWYKSRVEHVRGLLEAERETRTRVESAVGFLSKRR